MSDRYRPFVVASICREDLKEAAVTDAVIDRLTDEDMRHIAAMMGDLYSENGFWEDLKQSVGCFLEEKAGDEDDVVRCDICDSWVATHTVLVGQEPYSVCDKPRCQDFVDTLPKSGGQDE